jgi:D-aminoacyl-tRNA deacylase
MLPWNGITTAMSGLSTPHGIEEMRALLQRVKSASVSVDGVIRNAIEHGVLIFLGIGNGDAEAEAEYLAERCAGLRMFEDAQHKMNLSVLETGGSVLVVSQFTLYADTRKGHRPSFTDAAAPDVAERLYECFIARLRMELGEARVATGTFRAMMEISLVNDGPVTIMLESKNTVHIS